MGNISFFIIYIYIIWSCQKFGKLVRVTFFHFFVLFLLNLWYIENYVQKISYFLAAKAALDLTLLVRSFVRSFVRSLVIQNFVSWYNEMFPHGYSVHWLPSYKSKCCEIPSCCGFLRSLWHHFSDSLRTSSFRILKLSSLNFISILCNIWNKY